MKNCFMLMLLSLVFIGCSMPAPDAGHEVVLIDKPYIFGHGGVQSEPITTGRSIVWFSTQCLDVPMIPLKAEVELADTMTSDGVPITFHAIMILQITDSVRLIKYFGPDWYSTNIEEQFKTMVRQAVRKRGMNETAISTNAIDSIDKEIKGEMYTYLESIKIPVKMVNMTVGKANPPDAIKNQRIETAAQQQRIETEKQTKLAEDQRKMAEESRAQADNAYREAMHLSPEQYIQLEQIKMLATVGGKGATFIVGDKVSPVYNTNK